MVNNELNLGDGNGCFISKTCLFENTQMSLTGLTRDGRYKPLLVPIIWSSSKYKALRHVGDPLAGTLTGPILFVFLCMRRYWDVKTLSTSLP